MGSSRALLLAVSMTALAAGGVARAEPPEQPGAAPAPPPPADKAGAELLFDQARRLMDAAKYAEACEKFAASERLEPAVGTLLNLGGCHERQGKLATAWGWYREAAAMANVRADAERERFAKERAAPL